MIKKKVTVVLFHDDETGGYTAIMPTFPYCTTQGDSVADALLMAKESLELNLQEPSDWDLFNLDQAYSEHVVVGTVEVDVPSLPAPIPPEEETPTPSTEDAGGELYPATVSSILAQAGLTQEEFGSVADETL
jgi:predicted RNase H-like HicB family nuclease